MQEIESHAPGTFCWVELTTTDIAAARAFYEEVFGWTSAEQPTGPYVMFRLDGRDVAGGFEMGEEQRTRGQHPLWGSYVAVEDADAAAARVADLGGTVLAGPFDVLDQGRVVAIGDPAGAVFQLWQPGAHIGFRAEGEPGAPCWFELATRDAEVAGPFYRQLFGWATEESPLPGYTVFTLDDRQVAGMVEIDDRWPEGSPSHWQPYLAVADTDAVAGRAVELGGTLLAPPANSPYGRFAVVQDPQGAIVTLIHLLDR